MTHAPKPKPTTEDCLPPPESTCWLTAIRAHQECVEVVGGDRSLAAYRLYKALVSGKVLIIWYRLSDDAYGEVTPAELKEWEHHSSPGDFGDLWFERLVECGFLRRAASGVAYLLWEPDLRAYWSPCTWGNEEPDVEQQAEDAAVEVLKQNKGIKDWHSCEDIVLAQHPELRIEGDSRRLSALTHKRYRKALSRARGRLAGN
jgi:hypothetical protein